MIPISIQPEPQNFDELVRAPGKKLLSKGVPQSSRRFKNYWKNILTQLHDAYRGICAYSCMYIMPPGSVDHFLPKAQYPDLAYEWVNYRFSSPRLNQHKGDSLRIIDPVNVREGWFVLDFPSCLVKPGPGLPKLVSKEVEGTITALKLNIDDTLVQERCNIMVLFADGSVTLDFLKRRYPFLAHEIIRQSIQYDVKLIFKRRT